jgi:hypothetical protein
MRHTTKEAYDYTHDAIARAIVFKRSMVISLLQENGVSVSPMISNPDLTSAVLAAIGNSVRFQQAILPVLQEVKTTQHVQQGNFRHQQVAQKNELTLDQFSLPNKQATKPENRLGFCGERLFYAAGDEGDFMSAYETENSSGGGGTTSPTSSDNSFDENYFTPGYDSSASGGSSSSNTSSSPSFLGQVFNASFCAKSIKDWYWCGGNQSR